MRQIKINVTPELERDLQNLMRQRRCDTGTEAIRIAVYEAARPKPRTDFAAFEELRGAGLKGPTNPNPRFKDDDELWS
jgi:hypothetical protein